MARSQGLTPCLDSAECRTRRATGLACGRCTQPRATPERLAVIRRLADALGELDDLGMNEMGHLTYREATSFHALTDRARLLLDRLLGVRP